MAADGSCEYGFARLAYRYAKSGVKVYKIERLHRILSSFNLHLSVCDVYICMDRNRRLESGLFQG